MISVAEFSAEIDAWLSTNRRAAPRDYGAILPVSLAEAGQSWQRAIHRAGFSGIHWPTEYGGRGLTMEHTATWVRACVEAQVPAYLNMVGNVLTGGALLAFGTSGQLTEHLPSIISGERIWCQLFSEPNAGSDLASLSCVARRDGDEWVIDGQKVWCSNGRVADYGILLARTDPDASTHRGISFFLVDMRTAGVETRPLRQMNGASEFDEVFMTDARLPGTALLGPLHAGWTVAMSALTNERGYIGASGVSLQRRLNAMIANTSALDEHQTQRLAAQWIRGTALWATGQRQGPVASVLASIVKLGTTELMFDAAELRVAGAGADAMLMTDVTEGLLSAPGARIAGGTSQIQRNIIGERILGLPKEPKPPLADRTNNGH